MNNEDTNKIIGKKVYFVIYKAYGYTVCEGKITEYHQSVNMFSIKHIGSKIEYVVKASRIFNNKIDATKCKNTIKEFGKKRRIPKLL